MEKEVDEKFYINNEKANKLINTFKLDMSKEFLLGGEQKNQSIKTDGISTCLTSSMGTGGGYVPMVTEPIIAASRGRNPENPSDRTAGSPTEQRLEINQNGTSNTITTVQKDNYVLEPKRLGGLFDSEGRKRQAGAVWDKECIAPTIDTCQGGYREPSIIVRESTSCNQATLEHDYKIRRLTPKECWRLMGFKDEQFQKAEEVNSNSQLYKQAGNSIVVDVLYYIFRNLFIEKPKYRVQVDSEEQIPGQASILDFM